MEIKIGNIYVNKTWRFLVPTLQGYGNVLIRKLNLVFKLAVGIHDSYLDGADMTNGRNIYILLDKKHQPKDFEKFMEYIRCQEYFKGEYCPDENVTTSRRHTIILEIPERFNHSYDNFLLGKYSEMYTKEEINLIFTHQSGNNYEILSKTGEIAFNKHKEGVDLEFNVESNLDNLRAGEWELPLKKTEEIFNYIKGDSIFFNSKLDKVWQ
jgi:hypothetical protein